MKKVFSLTVRGEKRIWSFQFTGNEEDLEGWREDGLEVDEVINTIPELINNIGLAKFWCWLQDIGIIKI